MSTEVTEQNRVIAEFMQLKFRVIDYSNGQKNVGEIDVGSYWAQCKYHEDWNQLMAVVEKIESLADQKTGHISVDITENSCTVYQYNFKKISTASNGASKILAVHKAAYDFITWYNTTKQG